MESSTIRSGYSGLHKRSSFERSMSHGGFFCSSSPSSEFNYSKSFKQQQPSSSPMQKSKKTCMCSPTTHPGSYRCRLLKNINRSNVHQQQQQKKKHEDVPHEFNRLCVIRLAVTNSLVRAGAVSKGRDLVKKAIATLIRPSSHQQIRRPDFKPRPSRLAVV